jgi:hypothetical protein
LVYFARRALSWINVKRYYLKDQKKKNFLDFIIGDLTSSLEKLNLKNEEEFLPECVDTDFNGQPTLHLGFSAYKTNILTLRTVLEKHFLNAMKSIKANLPDIN